MTHIIAQLQPTQVGRTYGQIIDHFENRFGECGVEWRAKVLEVCREVVLDIASRMEWSWLHASATITTIADLAEYALEADVGFIHNGVMSITDTQTLTAKPLSFIRRINSENSAAAVPLYFGHVSRNSVILAPTLSAVYTILYDYYRNFTDNFTEDDYPPMPVSDQFVLLSGVEERLRADDNQIAGATQWIGSRYERMLAQLMFRDAQPAQMVPESLPPTAEGETWTWR